MLEIAEQAFPPISIVLVSSSPDGQNTYCASLQQELIPQVLPTLLQTTVATPLFNPAQKGNQVLVGVGGFVSLPDQGLCGFWFEQTVTV